MSIKSKKILSFLLSLTLIISSFLIVSTDAYADCDLKLVGASKLTGDQAVDMVNVAEANLSRTGKQVNAKEHWCADFIYNCARKANIGEDVIPTSGMVSALRDELMKCGAKVVKTPRAGDLVFYGSSHVGLMADSLYAYQGNFKGKGTDSAFWTSSQVVKCKYTSATNYAQYGATFVRPKYKTADDFGNLTITYNASGGCLKSDKYALASGNICLKDKNAFTDVWKIGETKSGGLYDAADFGLYIKGYSFGGWAYGSTVLSQSDEKLTAEIIEPKVKNENCSITLTAVWNPNKLTITFNANGGSVDAVKYSLDKNGIIIDKSNKNITSMWLFGVTQKPKELTENFFGLEKANMEFCGWSLKSGNNINDVLSAGVTAKDICSSVKNGDSSVTLYACWHKHTVVKDNAVSATCEKSGLTEGSHCFECGSVLSKQNVIFAKDHRLSKEIISKTEPTCTNKGEQKQKCIDCNKIITTVIPAKGHNTVSKVTEKATFTKNGKIKNICLACKKTVSEKKIASVKSVSLSKTKLSYNGSVQKPLVKIKNSDGKALKKGTDYTVKYSNGNSKNTGNYTVKITLKGKYKGTKTLKYSISPAKVSSVKAKGKKQSANISFKEVENADGYEIYFTWAKGAEYIKLASITGTSFTVNKLTSQKTYYFKVRAFKVVDGKKIYGPFSSAKKAKAK